jgi:hypothetical protein
LRLARCGLSVTAHKHWNGARKEGQLRAEFYI